MQGKVKTSFRLISLIILFASCVAEKKGVFLDEMPMKPTIETFDNRIVVNTENSIKNSALLIYRIDIRLDTINKIISLNGFQTVGKEYRNKFELKINGQTKEKLDNYKYYWIDPDNKRTEIKTKEK